MMAGGAEGEKDLSGASSSGGLSIFVNNPYQRRADNVEPTEAPPAQEERRIRKKRLSSESGTEGREAFGDSARKYRKLAEIPQLAHEESVIPTEAGDGQAGKGDVKRRKRKVAEKGEDGGVGVDVGAKTGGNVVGDEGVVEKKSKKKKRKQEDGKEQLSEGGLTGGEGLSNGQNVESAEAIGEEKKAGGQTGHARSRGAVQVEKEEDFGEEAAVAGGNVEAASPGKRKRGESDELVVKKKARASAEEEQERLLRTIFVGNLPTTVKKRDLITEFTQFGAVESARLRSVPLVDTKLPRRAAVITGKLNEQRSSLNAYVVFTSQESATAALVHNMKEFQGKHIRVDMASAPSKAGSNSVTYDKTRSLFVGNLPFDVEDEELIAVFAGPESELEGVRIVRDPKTSIGKGFAFVLFKTKEAASRALSKRSVTLRDRKLRIYRLGNSHQIEKQRQHYEHRKSALKRSWESSRASGDEPASKKPRGPLPYEGVRAGKQKAGKPGKWSPGAAKPAASKGVKRRGDNSGEPPKKKRPAVQARKAAALGKPGGGQQPSVGEKRKRDEKPNKGRKKQK